jgi:Fic family protein
VIANIDAMAFALNAVGVGDRITLDGILAVHEQLLAGSRLESHGGKLREEQNWIGGSGYNPCAAAYVPPPHELVPALMDDLIAFCNDEALPPVAQAAIAHAQFETIHPFVDGNGRVGRALLHMILRRRGLASNVLTPVSLVLATWATAYVDALTAFRYVGPSNSPAASQGVNGWASQFASACTRACVDAAAFEWRVAELQAEWRMRVGKVRKNSSVDLLLAGLPGVPVLTVASAASTIGRSVPAANNAVAVLAEAGVIQQVTIGKRNRAYEAREIIDAFTDLERQLASPEGNTRISAPSRRVPQRRQGARRP